MTEIRPYKIAAHRLDGYALDIHTISSEFLGYDGFGHEIFDTKRSELGELLYRLKSKQDINVIDQIVEIAINFINSQWKDIIDGIIPIPPSNVGRRLQPVIVIAKGIADNLGINLYEKALIKIRETPELKNILDFHARLALLKDVFHVNDEHIEGKRLLLFDDLFRSGATLNAATEAIYQQGKAGKVYVLTLTRTRILK